MISSVYNYYMANYAYKSNDKHSTHKRNELRSVYNSIVKLNKTSPFYKVDSSEKAQERAIDLKESAKSLIDITDDLADAVSGDMAFSSSAFSDDESVVHAEYVGEDKSAGTPGGFTVSVKQLATPQVNTGNFLNPRARNLPAGSYSFDVDISSVTYELQFSVKDNETNSDVQNKIARLINKSNIGIRADVAENPQGQTSLRLTSNMTGVGDRPAIFDISDDEASPVKGLVSVLGLDRTTSYPSNAVFDLNGETHVSTSNTFTVDREFEVTLRGVSDEGSSATISLRQNVDSLIDSIGSLADRYNRLTALAGSGSPLESNRLRDDMMRIAYDYSDVLNSNGLSVGDDGLITVDRAKLQASADSGSLITELSRLDEFKDAIQQKAHDVMINPMDYINKVIVSYKNPKHPSADPYTTSIYSGMMFNSYC